jgi:hypothetical protein
MKMPHNFVKTKTVLVSILLTLCSVWAIAQSSYTGGVQLEVKPTFSFQNDWKLNGRLASRTLLFEGSRTQSFTGISNYDRTELELVLTKKTSSSTSLGGGYLIRDQKSGIKHRLIQQFSISKKYEKLSLGHRFRFDETFQTGKATLYRFRYRIGIEKSLNWNNGKMSFFLNNEYIPSLQNEMVKMEARLFPGLSYKVNENNKLDFGLDYRIENLFTKTNKQVYLLYLSWNPNFNLASKHNGL